MALLAGLLTLPSLNANGAQDILRLTTTTSTYETGLLDHILPPFEKKHDAKVHIISAGTGKAINIAMNGDADVILVHAREAEDKFVRDGYGVNRRDVMYNDFIIMGPKSDPAGIASIRDAASAFRLIYEQKMTFVSRGDNSGTHQRELKLWTQLGLTPAEAWYLEAGQGMSATLRMADEKNAYVLIDRATYLASMNNVRLVNLLEGDPALLNPYGIIPVSPYRHKHVKYELAMALVAWLTSPDCQKMIAEYTKMGQQLYYPNADKTDM